MNPLLLAARSVTFVLTVIIMTISTKEASGHGDEARTGSQQRQIMHNLMRSAYVFQTTYMRPERALDNIRSCIPL